MEPIELLPGIMVAVENESKPGGVDDDESPDDMGRMSLAQKRPIVRIGIYEQFYKRTVERNRQEFVMRSLVREPIKKRITVLMSNHSTKHYDGVPPNWKHELCDMGTSHSRCFLALFWTGFTINQASADEHALVRNFDG